MASPVPLKPQIVNTRPNGVGQNREARGRPCSGPDAEFDPVESDVESCPSIASGREGGETSVFLLCTRAPSLRVLGGPPSVYTPLCVHPPTGREGGPPRGGWIQHKRHTGGRTDARDLRETQ